MEGKPEYDDHIIVLTRTGGGNREDYDAENEAMQAIDQFVTDFDDDFDSTYAYWVFEVPEKRKDDFQKITSGQIMDISEEYREELYSIFPKLKDQLDEIFKDKE